MPRLAGHRTGIVASVGRTFCARETVKQGIEAGALGFRLALGLHDRDHAGDLAVVREAAAELGQPVSVMLDLPATRPRTGAMTPRLFTPGQRAILMDREDAGPEEHVVVPVPGLRQYAASLKTGHRVLFRDGRQQFRVWQADDEAVQVECEACSEPVRAANACSFPDSGLTFGPLRQQDSAVMEALASRGLRPDWVAVSLVTAPEQVEEIRGALRRTWPEDAPAVMVKIETRRALQGIRELLEVSEGCLLGRGDLGLAIPAESLPLAQRDVVAEAKRAGKPVTVATQVFEHFARTGQPYRAELSDVALMVRQGVDGVVLCSETSDSERPVQGIELLRKLIEVESLDEDSCR